MSRRIGVLIAAVLLSATTAVFADDSVLRAKNLFLQAAEYYKKGDYEMAVRLNSQALATGFESAAIHYNLGNSYLRSRQLGRAIASYLKAQRLSPGDVDVLANLNYARGMVSAPALAETRPFWSVPFERFTPHELRWVALVVFMFTATVSLVGLYAGWKRRKVLAWAVAGGVVFIYCLIGVFDRAAEDAGLGVCVEGVAVTFEPSTQATTYFQLPEGAEVRILREKDGWSKVERADGRIGWAPSNVVEKI
jgi:tetratricopeptide (TPR) repeat protein